MDLTTALIWFGLITVVVLTLDIWFTYLTKGFGYGFSSNRSGGERTGLGLRLQRSLQNQMESAAYVVPALGAGIFLGLDGQGVQIAALLIVLGRAAFLPLYWTGVPFIRVPAFAVAILGSVYILVVALLNAGA